jgi:hypothetical protein
MAPEAEDKLGAKPPATESEPKRARKTQLRRSIAWWRKQSTIIEKTSETIGWWAVIVGEIFLVWWTLTHR